MPSASLRLSSKLCNNQAPTATSSS
ncbi:hypothetical protein PanWU01x14_252750 [Parasponia andersonii]|uniref:Uncharacterized protein n=1 Tax=Parasponia andersonii TaxID=3476 RepID=A0A2P5BBU9_PARAD|nr:hypothetical protein PanWU01x14_252750 [Parasponia andersonii]